MNQLHNATIQKSQRGSISIGPASSIVKVKLKAAEVPCWLMAAMLKLWKPTGVAADHANTPVFVVLTPAGVLPGSASDVGWPVKLRNTPSGVPCSPMADDGAMIH